MKGKWHARLLKRWRLALLLLAVVVSVMLPYLFTRSTTNSALDASHWVATSSQVRVTVYRLLYRLRDIEAATYSVLQGVRSDDLTQRIERGAAQIEPLLATLRGLTLDNADQQARLGALKNVVEHRVALMRKARKLYAAGHPAAAYRALGKAANIYPYSALAEDIVRAEKRMQVQRDEVARRKTRTAQLVQTGAALAQLLLLGLVAVLAERAALHRLRAERISRHAIVRAQRIVQTVREPMAILDSRLNLSMVNAAFEELYGDTGAVGAETEAARHELSDVGDGAWSDDAVRQRLIDVLARDRELWDYELAQTTIDGVDRHMLVNAQRMELPEGDEPAMLLSVSDVTARTLAENQISELNQQLEGKIEQLSEVNHELEAFSYSVSHDLRAPLRHIAGFSDKLGRHLGTDIDDKTTHYLDVIGTATGHMAQLIDGLLAYSRLGRGALRMQPVDMNALAAEVHAELAGTSDGRDIAWEIGQLPTVIGDARMLRTVWQNLLGNAVKYTSQREHARIEVSVERSDDGAYVFTVRDNGAGFDMAYADKLFGVFQRMHKASEFPGSGIGLANVRRIILRHGGKVWAEAERGKGASFHFSLPVPQGMPA
ncbi:MAG TPA: ATP-binding protein [Oleiagrimonas sp.]|nr:ATP-binding protein [Oleiagrimonas sp.]